MNSKIVYDIPMIIWTSPEFLRDHQEMLTPEILSRPIWMGNLLPSLAQFSGITSEHLDTKDSFFEQDFSKVTRMCDGELYDTLEGPERVQ